MAVETGNHLDRTEIESTGIVNAIGIEIIDTQSKEIEMENEAKKRIKKEVERMKEDQRGIGVTNVIDLKDQVEATGERTDQKVDQSPRVQGLATSTRKAKKKRKIKAIK